MPWLGILVFLCSYLHPCPCMLGFANVVYLLQEHMCLHMEVECALVEAESDSYDSCLTEVVDCDLMADMSLRREGGNFHTCGRERVRIRLCEDCSYFPAKSRPELPKENGVTNLRSRPLSIGLVSANPRGIRKKRYFRHKSVKSSYKYPQTVMVLLVCDGVDKYLPKRLARHANHIRIHHRCHNSQNSLIISSF